MVRRPIPVHSEQRDDMGRVSWSFGSGREERVSRQDFPCAHHHLVDQDVECLRHLLLEIHLHLPHVGELGKVSAAVRAQLVHAGHPVGVHRLSSGCGPSGPSPAGLLPSVRAPPLVSLQRTGRPVGLFD